MKLNNETLIDIFSKTILCHFNQSFPLNIKNKIEANISLPTTSIMLYPVSIGHEHRCIVPIIYHPATLFLG